MIKVTVYNNYYKDEQMTSIEFMNTTQALEAIDRLMRGTELDILVTRTEDE